MLADFMIFVSKRGQRCAAAVLLIMLLHGVMAGCAPQPVGPPAVRVDISR